MRKSLAVVVILLAVSSAASVTQAQSKFPCRNWLRLAQGPKLYLLRKFIETAKEDKTILRLSAEYYVEELDKLIRRYADTENEKALDAPLGLTIHTIAAMEGDWDNGEDPLEHARKFMGEELFEAFKKMYPEKYKKLVERSKKKE